MKETIIKGTGNSRSIKSVTTLPLTWEDARAQLISSGWPVDIGAINAAGCQQVGDALNKANLLKDATAALYGLGATAVPDQVLAKIRPLITAAQNSADSATVRAMFGAFAFSSTTLNFNFKPYIIIVVTGTTSTKDLSIAIRSGPVLQRINNLMQGTVEWDEYSVKLSGLSSATWNYAAIGLK